VQQRLDANPQAMRLRRETVEHPFGTMKARMGATHFLTKTFPKVVCFGSWSCKNARPGKSVRSQGPVRSQATIAAISGLVSTMFMTRVIL
jgi:hypothetical protein